jgi:hypothetical protein
MRGQPEHESQLDARNMLSAEDFRRIALGMKDAVESAHMGHPDFRINNRIFATLHADHQHGMVKLTLEQQEIFVREHPVAFAPENGAWGRQGCTAVRLDLDDEDTVGEAMTLAWGNSVVKRVSRRPKATRTTRRIPRSRKS